MCGVVGIYSYQALEHNSRKYIDWCLGTMQRRGPDSSGIWVNSTQTYIAGFNRLAIRDLSQAGNQPMVSNDGKYCIVFNGEIYNTDFLRKKLNGIPIKFRSSSDTEILLNLLIFFPVEKVLSWVDGMFVFAFYNDESNELIIARDRVGIKPLYIGANAKGIIYSSQYDHIINHEWVRDQSFDYENIGLYLQLGYLPAGHGAIKNTQLFPHGYFARITSKGIEWTRYYEIPQNTINSTYPDLLSKITESVKSQLVSDVPLGTFMSGGTDSPFITSVANQFEPTKSFTIGIKDSPIDESQIAEQYAELFKNEHHCQIIEEEDFLDQIDANFSAYSEPFADYSSIPTLVLSGFAKKKLTVALSGDGPDELMWGYPRNLKMLEQGLLFQQSKWNRARQLILRKIFKVNNSAIKRHIEVDNFIQFYYRSLFITGAEAELNKIYQIKPAEAKVLKCLNIKMDSSLSENNIMDVVRKLEMELHLQRILLKVDRASMYHSLEVRVPYLSNEMLDACFQLNHNECIKNKSGKYPLKELLIERTNEPIVLQPKKGFTIPIENWTRGRLKKDIEEKILNMPASLAAAFHTKGLEILLNEHFAEKKDRSWLIWAIYSLIKWQDTHVQKIRG